jgi:hypothetical protein
MFVLGIYSAATGSRFLAGYDGLGIALFFGAILVCATWMRSRTAASVARSSGQANEVLVLTVPARKRLILAAIFVALAVGSYLLMESAPARRALLFQLIFALFASVALMALIAASGRVSLTLTREGLDYTPFRVGLISWRDIRGFKIKRFRHLDAIALDIVAPEKYRSRHILRRILGAHFDVSPTIFGQDTEWLASEIKKRITAFGPRSRAVKESSAG